MKKTASFVLYLLISVTLMAGENPATNHWTDGTALNVPRHRWELSLLSSSVYGITDRLEISAHPLAFFAIPQGKLKIGWIKSGIWTISTEHGFFCPTPFMNLAAAKGTGGLISPEFSIPFMVAVTNRILVSASLPQTMLLTFSSGIAFSFKQQKPDPGSTIDLPLIYPRLAIFYSQPGFDFNFDFRGRIISRFGWDFRVENYLFCNTTEKYFMENKGVLVYISKNDKLRIEGGYKLCFGEYPAGPQWHLLPALNIYIGLGK